MVTRNGDEENKEEVVLSAEEWRRIRECCVSSEKGGLPWMTPEDRKELELRRLVEEEQRARGETSRKMVGQWIDTIQNQRERREEARRARLEQEKKQRLLDVQEEVRLRQQERQQATERAQRALFYQSSRVRALHSALLLDEVLRERERQIALKREDHPGRWSKEEEVKREVEQRRIQQEQEDRERKTRERKQRLAEETAKQLRLQVDQRREAKEMQKKEASRVSQEMSLLDEQFVDELQEARIKQEEQREKIRQEALKYQTTKQEMADAAATKEREEALRREVKDIANKRMLELRMLKEDEEKKARIEMLDKVQEEIWKQLKKEKDDQEVRIQKVTEERERQELKMQQERQRKKDKAKEEFLQHLKEQAKWKKKQTEAMVHEKELARQELDEEFRLFQEECENRRCASLQRNKVIQEEQLKQMNEKAEKTKEEREAWITEGRKHLEALDEEEKKFMDYAATVKQQSDSQRNVIQSKKLPLAKASEEGLEGGRGPVYYKRGGIRPLYMTSDNSGQPLLHIHRGKESWIQ